jgi:hypothetical protein
VVALLYYPTIKLRVLGVVCRNVTLPVLLTKTLKVIQLPIPGHTLHIPSKPKVVEEVNVFLRHWARLFCHHEPVVLPLIRYLLVKRSNYMKMG